MKLLFVCTGNTCRSPMAAAIANHLAKKQGLDVIADSAGVSAFDGMPATENAVAALSEIGMDLSLHQSKRVTPALLNWADRIYSLTSSHRSALMRAFPELSSKIMVLGDGIDDPYGLPLAEYREARDKIKEAVEKLLAEIKNDSDNFR